MAYIFMGDVVVVLFILVLALLLCFGPGKKVEYKDEEDLRRERALAYAKRMGVLEEDLNKHK